MRHKDNRSHFLLSPHLYLCEILLLICLDITVAFVFSVNNIVSHFLSLLLFKHCSYQDKQDSSLGLLHILEVLLMVCVCVMQAAAEDGAGLLLH